MTQTTSRRHKSDIRSGSFLQEDLIEPEERTKVRGFCNCQVLYFDSYFVSCTCFITVDMTNDVSWIWIQEFSHGKACFTRLEFKSAASAFSVSFSTGINICSVDCMLNDTIHKPDLYLHWIISIYHKLCNQFKISWGIINSCTGLDGWVGRNWLGGCG